MNSARLFLILLWSICLWVNAKAIFTVGFSIIPFGWVIFSLAMIAFQIVSFDV